MLDDILKNMNLFVDGRGYAGNIDELTLPKLALKLEEFRNGGMDAPLEQELGMEKIECSFSLTRFDRDVLLLFGVKNGVRIPFTMRGAVESDDGTITAVVVNLEGFIKEIDYGSWKAGDKAMIKLLVSCRSYKLTHGGAVVHDIDIPNMVRVINGVDQLSEQRAALGV